MLVLSRQLYGVIRIGETIRITVIKIRGATVRLQISAPLEDRILRGEIVGAPAAEVIESDDAEDDHAPGSEGGGGLVLSRKRHQTIVINDDIVITVVEIRGGKVRLGITAPLEVPVHRDEVYEAIAAEGLN